MKRTAAIILGVAALLFAVLPLAALAATLGTVTTGTAPTLTNPGAGKIARVHLSIPGTPAGANQFVIRDLNGTLNMVELGIDQDTTVTMLTPQGNDAFCGQGVARLTTEPAMFVPWVADRQTSGVAPVSLAGDYTIVVDQDATTTTVELDLYIGAR